MSRKIKQIVTCFVCILTLCSCNTARIPTEYRFKPKEVEKTTTGCWIDIITSPANKSLPGIKISGELIAIQYDTIYLLTEIQLNGIPESEVKNAVLYIYNNQAGPFMLATVLLLIPNIIAAIANNEAYFLLLDVPWLIGGTFISINESTRGSHQLKYPEKNNLDDIGKFARFPQGIPPGLNKDKLHLKHTQ